MKIFNYKLEIGILRNSFQSNLGVLSVAFWVSKKTPRALLAKTILPIEKLRGAVFGEPHPVAYHAVCISRSLHTNR